MNADDRRTRGLVTFLVCTLLATAIMLFGEIVLVTTYDVPRYIAAPIVQAIAVTVMWVVGYLMYYRYAEPRGERGWVTGALLGGIATIAIVVIRIMLRLG